MGVFESPWRQGPRIRIGLCTNKENSRLLESNELCLGVAYAPLKINKEELKEEMG